MLNGGYIQSKQVDKAVSFLDPLKWLKLKTLASDGVIKKDNVKTISLFIYYAKLYMLHRLTSALNLEIKIIIDVKGSNLWYFYPAMHCFTCCDTSSSFI